MNRILYREIRGFFLHGIINLRADSAMLWNDLKSERIRSFFWSEIPASHGTYLDKDLTGSTFSFSIFSPRRMAKIFLTIVSHSKNR